MNSEHTFPYNKEWPIINVTSHIVEPCMCTRFCYIYGNGDSPKGVFKQKCGTTLGGAKITTIITGIFQQ